MFLFISIKYKELNCKFYESEFKKVFGRCQPMILAFTLNIVLVFIWNVLIGGIWVWSYNKELRHRLSLSYLDIRVQRVQKEGF